MKTVTLRIVGLFFNKKFQIEDAVDTVKGVMDAYRGITRNKISNPEGLTYTVETNTTIKKISFNSNGEYDFVGNFPAVGNGKSLGGKNLKARVYSLSERKLGKNSQLAWQYYVLDSSGINKSRTPQAAKFTPFDETSTIYSIADGDTIIWRLVAINLPMS